MNWKREPSKREKADRDWIATIARAVDMVKHPTWPPDAISEQQYINQVLAKLQVVYPDFSDVSAERIRREVAEENALENAEEFKKAYAAGASSQMRANAERESKKGGEGK